MSRLEQAPRFDAAGAASLGRALFGITATASPLPSERDQNFRIEVADGRRFVLKIANADESRALLESQNAAMARAATRGALVPEVVRAPGGETILTADGPDGRTHFVRLVRWLPGAPLASLRHLPPALLEDLGRQLARLDAALEGFDDAAIHRVFDWDLTRAPSLIASHLDLVADPALRDLVEWTAARAAEAVSAAAPRLRAGAIHNDANDYNVLVAPDGRVSGVIDFGDLIHSWIAAEPAVAIAYAMLDAPAPLDVAAAVVRGYHAAYPLLEAEAAVVFDLALLRLCLSAVMAGRQMGARPDDAYLAISQAPIARTLPRAAAISRGASVAAMRQACGFQASNTAVQSPAALRDSRGALIGPSVRLSYREPLQIVRGWMQYLYDQSGRRYLDAYNNVPHVGHCHPHVVRAAAAQLALLNTNTRYLHQALTACAARLATTLPEPLRVCYFVNSGTEANELALRLARAFTGRHDVLVLDHAYHGHSTTMIDVSPYKFNGPGGQGARPWVHVAELPDTYRGPYRRADAADRYASDVGVLIAHLGPGRLAAFLAETCPSVAGQILLPDGYLPQVYAHVRAAGGVCIADEVQTAYGRMGSHFYAFQAHGVTPDIVVLGKPIGNGYPLGAVVTTPAIAAAFDNGMEFFSTFGGSTVSCAAGLAVLDVLEEERLQEHAARVGNELGHGLEGLRQRHALVGSVRGSGLFWGVELVQDRGTRTPASREASHVVERLREEGILIGTDGPLHNVLKIRPPMPFTSADAARLVETLDRAIEKVRT